MNVAIVVAAGKGTRLGGVRPKQFLELGGVPIIIHTLRQFERSQQIDEIIAVLSPEETANFLSFAQDFGLKRVSRAVAGGATTKASKNAPQPLPLQLYRGHVGAVTWPLASDVTVALPVSEPPPAVTVNVTC